MGFLTHTILWIGLGFSITKLVLAAEFSATNKYFLVKEKREECNIYLNIANKINTELHFKKNTFYKRKEETELLKKALDECGESKGVSKNEYLLSELCSRDYNSWLKSLITIEVENKELSELIEQRIIIKRKLSFECPYLGS